VRLLSLDSVSHYLYKDHPARTGIDNSASKISIMSAAKHSMYNYVPSTAAAITFLTLYGISTVTHLAQAVYYRTYWLTATAAFCGIIEILGWSGRLWSSYSPFLKIPFQIQ